LQRLLPEPACPRRHRYTCHDAADGEGFESLQELPETAGDCSATLIILNRLQICQGILRGSGEIFENVVVVCPHPLPLSRSFGRGEFPNLTPCPSPDAAGEGVTKRRVVAAFKRRDAVKRAASAERDVRLKRSP
jgi:hypothetical protein